MNTAPLPDWMYETKGPMVLRIIITFPIIAALVVSLRFFTRIQIVRVLAIDDWLILAAMIFSIGTSIAMGFQVHYGMGRHLMTLHLSDGTGSLKALFASIIAYNFGLSFTKLSILFQYLRIAVAKPLRMSCWALVAFTVANGIQTFVSGMFTCIPIHRFWDTHGAGHCVNESALWFANAGINILQDVALIIIPLFLIKDLMLPRRQKVILFAILALGGFACITSVLRLHAVYVVTISKDITWDNPSTATWSCIELNVGIICASLPTLRALVSKVFPHLMPTRRTKQGKSNYGSRYGSRWSSRQGSRKLQKSSNASDFYNRDLKSEMVSRHRDLELGIMNSVDEDKNPIVTEKMRQEEGLRLASGVSRIKDQRKMVEAYCQAGTQSFVSSTLSPPVSPTPGFQDAEKTDSPAGIKVVTTTRQVVEYASDESLPPKSRANSAGSDSQQKLLK